MYTQAQIQPLLDAANAVLSNEDATGCCDDLTVTSLEACDALRAALRALPPEQTLVLGLHSHRHGDSIYPYLVPNGQAMTSGDFETLLGDEFEPDREESAEVQPYPDSEVEFFNGSAAEAAPATPQYVGPTVRRVLLPNGCVIGLDAGNNTEALISVSVYELEDKERDERDEFLSRLVTGDPDMLMVDGHFVEGRDVQGALNVMVVGSIDPDDPANGIKEPLCQKCGSHLGDDGYCPDATCAYSDWPQQVSMTDLTTLPREQIEREYDITKRSRAAD